MKDYLLVNFGGPRTSSEIPIFLKELLCDRDVVRTRYPTFFHNWLFRRIAKKRALKVAPDYERIGGKSPIFSDTENIAQALSEKLKRPVFTLHRYLPSTHAASLARIEASQAHEIVVIPLFPQFSFATSGSLARFLSKSLSKSKLASLRWIPSYPSHPAYIASFQRKIHLFLEKENLWEEEVVFLFSAHGLPASFIAKGDSYQAECEISFREIRKAFPNALTRLSYQSKFGPEEWLRPSTEEACQKILQWNEKRRCIVFVPLSFTSDHIETLFEIEHLYLPLIRDQGLKAYRCPALNLEPYWIDALAKIAGQMENLCETAALIRK